MRRLTSVALALTLGIAGTVEAAVPDKVTAEVAKE
jgi:hypothetical protein